MLGRLNRPTPRTSVVRVVAGIEGFVADDGIEHTNLPVNAIAHGRAQGDISLLDGSRTIFGGTRFSSILTGGFICGRIPADGVWAEE